MAGADHLHQGTGYCRMDKKHEAGRGVLRYRGEYWVVHHARCEAGTACVRVRAGSAELRGADSQPRDEQVYQDAVLRLSILHLGLGTRRYLAPEFIDRG